MKPFDGTGLFFKRRSSTSNDGGGEATVNMARAHEGEEKFLCVLFRWAVVDFSTEIPQTAFDAQ